MKREKIQVEYFEESMRNLLVLVKAFVQLLLDRNYIDEVSLDRMMQVTYARQPIQVNLLIPMVCTACGRKGTGRPGQNMKCLYCGRELRFNLKDEQADEILASLDVSKLFGFTVKATDITADDRFISTAAEITAVPSRHVHRDERGNCYIETDTHAMAANGKIIVAQNIVAAHQKQANLLCEILFSIWELVSARNPEAGSKLLEEFFTIDDDKKQHAYDALYASMTCAKCHTEQWPTSLFYAKCSVCGELLPARLLPGLHVMQIRDANVPSQCTPKERKIEYPYTLFEALFHCAGSAFGLTLDDLAKEINEVILPYDSAEGQLVCRSCVQRFSNALVLRGRCPYCGESVSAAVPDPVF